MSVEWDRFNRNPLVSVSVVGSAVVSLMNFCEIVYIARKNKKTSYEVLLLSLSFSDSLFATVNIVPAFSSRSALSWIVEILRFVYVMSFCLSMFHLIALAIDRLVAVRFPLKHKTYWRLKYACILSIFFWIFTVSTLFLMHEYKYTISPLYHLKLLKICIISVIGLTDITLVVVYAIIFIHLYHLSKSNVTTFNQSQQKQNKSPLILCALTAVLFITSTVQTVVEALRTLDQSTWISNLACLFLVLNAGLNSFLYFFHGKLKSYFGQRGRRINASKRNDIHPGGKIAKK